MIQVVLAQPRGFGAVVERAIDICYATRNRQRSGDDLAKQVDPILVVRSTNRSRSNRVGEIGIELWKPNAVIDDAAGLEASAPERLIQVPSRHFDVSVRSPYLPCQASSKT